MSQNGRPSIDELPSLPIGTEIARGLSTVWSFDMQPMVKTAGIEELKHTTCNCCEGWAESPTETLKFLRGERQVCARCPRKATIDAAARQFKSRHRNWWVVGGILAVPVWIKEQLRNPPLPLV